MAAQASRKSGSGARPSSGSNPSSGSSRRQAGRGRSRRGRHSLPGQLPPFSSSSSSTARNSGDIGEIEEGKEDAKDGKEEEEKTVVEKEDVCGWGGNPAAGDGDGPNVTGYVTGWVTVQPAYFRVNAPQAAAMMRMIEAGTATTGDAAGSARRPAFVNCWSTRKGGHRERRKSIRELHDIAKEVLAYLKQIEDTNERFPSLCRWPQKGQS